MLLVACSASNRSQKNFEGMMNGLSENSIVSRLSYLPENEEALFQEARKI